MELSATYQKISELQERLDILSVHLELEEKQAVSYTHLTLPTIYSV